MAFRNAESVQRLSTSSANRVTKRGLHRFALEPEDWQRQELRQPTGSEIVELSRPTSAL